MRARDQFGHAGTSAGQLQERQILAVRDVLDRLDVPGTGQPASGPDGDTRGPVARVAPVGVREQDPVTQRRRLQLGQLPDPVRLPGISRGRGDDHHRFRDTAELLDLQRTVLGKGEHRHRAEPEQGEVHDVQLDPVVDLHHDPVAALHARIAQPGGSRVDGPVQFAVGQLRTSVPHGRAVTEPSRPVTQESAQGFLGPVPEIPVALGGLGRPRSQIGDSPDGGCRPRRRPELCLPGDANASWAVDAVGTR